MRDSKGTADIAIGGLQIFRSLVLVVRKAAAQQSLRDGIRGAEVVDIPEVSGDGTACAKALIGLALEGVPSRSPARRDVAELCATAGAPAVAVVLTATWFARAGFERKALLAFDRRRRRNLARVEDAINVLGKTLLPRDQKLWLASGPYLELVHAAAKASLVEPLPGGRPRLGGAGGRERLRRDLMEDLGASKHRADRIVTAVARLKWRHLEPSST